MLKLLSLYVLHIGVEGKANGLVEIFTHFFNHRVSVFYWTQKKILPVCLFSYATLKYCLWTRLQVHGSKRLGCHADQYTVSRCHTRGESEDHTSMKALRGSILTLNPGQMSPEVQNRYQWRHKISFWKKGCQIRWFLLTAIWRNGWTGSPLHKSHTQLPLRRRESFRYVARCLRSYGYILISIGLRKQKLSFTAWQLWIWVFVCHAG